MGDGHRTPADVLVGADQEHAVLADLADPRPVVVDVGDLAARPVITVLTGTSSSSLIFLAALAHALPAMPEISVNVCTGAGGDPASGRAPRLG